jgi:hypothetical protein
LISGFHVFFNMQNGNIRYSWANNNDDQNSVLKNDIKVNLTLPELFCNNTPVVLPIESVDRFDTACRSAWVFMSRSDTVSGNNEPQDEIPPCTMHRPAIARDLHRGS